MEFPESCSDLWLCYHHPFLTHLRTAQQPITEQDKPRTEASDFLCDWQHVHAQKTQPGLLHEVSKMPCKWLMKVSGIRWREQRLTGSTNTSFWRIFLFLEPRWGNRIDGADCDFDGHGCRMWHEGMSSARVCAVVSVEAGVLELWARCSLCAFTESRQASCPSGSFILTWQMCHQTWAHTDGTLVFLLLNVPYVRTPSDRLCIMRNCSMVSF